MDILEILRQDYAKFPIDQNYDIYAEDVYFQDPTSKFRGLGRYRKTIAFIQKWFKNPHLELQEIKQIDRLITTRWSLSWNTPLPWEPRIEITGRSELLLDNRDLIISHIDYWDRPLLDVVKQHLRG